MLRSQNTFQMCVPAHAPQETKATEVRRRLDSHKIIVKVNFSVQSADETELASRDEESGAGQGVVGGGL